MKFLTTATGPAGGTPGWILSTVLHLAVVVVYNLGTAGSVQSEPIQEPLPEGLRFLVPPSASPEQPVRMIGYHDPQVGTGETMDPAEESRRLDQLARRRGVEDSLAADRAAVAAALAAASAEQVVPTVYADAYMEIEVDSAAIRHPESGAPAYPAELMRLGISGFAAVRFVVDSTGSVDLESAQRIDASREEFWVAVREALPKMRFTPARRGTTAVRQLAEQMFRFQIKTADTATTVTPSRAAPRRRPPV